MTISSGNITDEIIQKYIEDQEGETVEIGQFEIDSTLIPPQLRAYGCLVLKLKCIIFYTSYPIFTKLSD